MRQAQTVEKTQKDKRISRRRELDGVYLILLCAITCAGLLMLISASTPASINGEEPYGAIIKNSVIALICFLIMLFVANGPDYIVLRKLSPYFYYICLIVMFLTPLIGVEVYGAKRWINLLGISFQPSEIMKVAMIIYLAEVLSRPKKAYLKEKEWWRKLYVRFLPEIVIALPAAGAVVQSHLSGALIICAIGFVMLIVDGLPKRYIFLTGGGIVAAGGLLIIFEPYRMERIFGYMHPENDPLGNGWQILQSLYAICSGGLFGLGFGQSRQKYNWLPMASNDYIFAVLCEEFGIIGGIATILLFIFFIWRGIRIAVNARDIFGALIAFGVSSMIALQAIINIAVVTNAIPSTGMQLPFFSSGGTSLLFVMIAVGIVLNISGFQRNSSIRKIK